jgi:hypothetical protein
MDVQKTSERFWTKPLTLGLIGGAIAVKAALIASIYYFGPTAVAQATAAVMGPSLSLTTAALAAVIAPIVIWFTTWVVLPIVLTAGLVVGTAALTAYLLSKLYTLVFEKMINSIPGGQFIKESVASVIKETFSGFPSITSYFSGWLTDEEELEMHDVLKQLSVQDEEPISIGAQVKTAIAEITQESIPAKIAAVPVMVVVNALEGYGAMMENLNEKSKDVEEDTDLRFNYTVPVEDEKEEGGVVTGLFNMLFSGAATLFANDDDEDVGMINLGGGIAL